MSENIEVSIVIAAWNAQDFILNAINSALSQKNVVIEIVVVDDASTDDTCLVVESINDSRVKLLRSDKNGGPGAARNMGFAAAKGKWIAVLDSDDTMEENRLVEMIRKGSSDSDVLIDNFCEMSPQGNVSLPFYSSSELPIGPLSLSFLLSSNEIFTAKKATGYVKPLFRNSFIVKHQIKYWEDIRIGEDYYFLACCLGAGGRAEVVNLSGYRYTIREGSISRVMAASHVSKLLHFDHVLVDKLSLTVTQLAAQEKRTKNLKCAYYYLVIVEQIKSKHVLNAAINIIRHPRSALLLSLPIKKRLFSE